MEQTSAANTPEAIDMEDNNQTAPAPVKKEESEDPSVAIAELT